MNQHTFDLSQVEFSRNDIRLGIKVPEYLTEELAYFLGFHVGDGFMTILRRGSTVDYRLSYDGHAINEILQYEEVLKPLIKCLFNKEVTPKKVTQGTITIYIYSKAIVTFLENCCGIPLSPKRDIDIPQIIKNSSLEIKAHFLRGLADTDFSLTFHREVYPRINYVTYSKNLHESVKILLQELGFIFYSGTMHRKRNETKIISHQIDINGKQNLEKWMNIVGFSSYNTLTRYAVWKETGSLSRGTDINERIKILKERRINSPPL